MNFVDNQRTSNLQELDPLFNWTKGRLEQVPEAGPFHVVDENRAVSWAVSEGAGFCKVNSEINLQVNEINGAVCELQLKLKAHYVAINIFSLNFRMSLFFSFSKLPNLPAVIMNIFPASSKMNFRGLWLISAFINTL